MDNGENKQYCKKCGGFVEWDMSHVLLSLPAKYKGKCKDCGGIAYIDESLLKTLEGRVMLTTKQIVEDALNFSQTKEGAVSILENHIDKLQKELDELKVSIPKIKADAVREAVRNCEVTNNGYEGFLSQMDLIRYANQLEGKE